MRTLVHPDGKKDMLPTTNEDQDCNELNSGICFLAGKFRPILILEI